MASVPFVWSEYLNATRSWPVPPSAFSAAGIARQVSLFRRGAKLEAVDARNPALVRVATIADAVGRQVKVSQ